jgi:phosphotransferase system enzyme I (PtsI)
MGSEIRLKGVPISPGVAVARVCLFNDQRHSRLTPATVAQEDLEREIERLQRALEEAAARLSLVRDRVGREVGPAEAEIFTAQIMMLGDNTLHGKMIAAIRGERAGAELAVTSVMDAYEARISALDNEYLRERASDIGEVKRRLLDALSQTRPGFQCEGSGHCQRGRERIVVAAELTPSMTVDLDTAHLRGFVTAHGGVTSHAAILARSLGIPAVSGLRDIHNMIACGAEVLVDGTQGEVIVWPSAATVAATPQSAAIRNVKPVEPVCGMRVMANISLASEVSHAVRMKAEGIGLYRTEFEFMAAGRLLSEDEQAERYASVLKAMAGAPVHIRLADIGGDKPAPYLKLPDEANPALGFRGARLLRAHPELVRSQARAMARASAAGVIRITYPMIVDVEQFRALKAMVLEAVADLGPACLLHGVMFEVPSACVEASALLKEADFGSIGTNDLFQYLFAIDRNNEWVTHDFVPDRAAFWAMIKGVIKAARRHGKPLSVCGEIAGWPDYVLRLKQLGIEAVSVSSRAIPVVRNTLLREGKGQ